jgi:hypothetical protein
MILSYAPNWSVIYDRKDFIVQATVVLDKQKYEKRVRYEMKDSIRMQLDIWWFKLKVRPLKGNF